MRARRTAAIATGVMIGLSAVAPAANAQAPAMAATSVAAHGGHHWFVNDARREFRMDLRQARRDFRADLREARKEFRQDIREAHQERRATFWQARKALRADLRQARRGFRSGLKQANETFRTTVAASRNVLLAVVQNPASTADERKAAFAVYRTDVKQAREVRRTAVKTAIGDYRAARIAARKAFREAIGK